MSQQYRIRKEDILETTRGGLDIILSYYPDAEDCIDKKGKKFKMRDEKTPSAAIKKAPDGNWLVADFGDDGKWLNGITLCMKEENLDFGGAIKFLAERFNIGGAEAVKSLFTPEITVTDAKPDQEEKEWDFNVYEEIPDHYLQILFAEKVISAIDYDHRHIVEEADRVKAVNNHLRKLCTKLHWFALRSYSIIKNRKSINIGSTDFYPIFMIHEEGFEKIYQPKSEDKGKRFIYHGKFQKDFLHGHSQTIEAFNDLNKTDDKKKIEEVADQGGEKIQLKKHPELIYCTGGSDALNVYAMGYQVVWPSSEYYKLEPGMVKRFFSIAENVLTLPDLDPTGQKQNHRLMMDDRDDVFLEIKTINLPEELKLKRDFRGNPCKDVRDYLRFYTRKNFKGLVSTALPYRFWDTEVSRNKDGSAKMRFGRPVFEYKPNNLRMYNFLRRNGFYRYKVDVKADYFYINIEGNMVKQVEAIDIKNFINKFLETRQQGEDLRNAFYRTNQLSEMSLSSLELIDIDFTDYDKKEQYFFFDNYTWKVTPTGVEAFKPGDVDKLVWNDEVIPHKVKKLPDMFTITRNEANGDYEIDIHHTDCLFFRYLINTSRIHWRKELEERLAGLPLLEQEAYLATHKFSIDGPKLSEEEIREQKLHLINKIYSLGYLLHRYKDPTKPWNIFAMDDKITDDGLSHGGSGKSIAYKAPRHFLKTVTFDGRNPKLFDDNHVMERVNKHVDYMLFDDAGKNFQFERMISFTTGEMTVNPKGKTQIELQNKDVPKSAITSNFVPNEFSPTTLRRILFTVFGDYYHHENNGEYNETRDPQSDFGKSLFDDFTEAEWNYFCNFMAQCCRWHMNFGKIEPPMGNVMTRNLMSYMGNAFRLWADVYFGDEADRRDALVIKKIAMDDFVRETRLTGWATQAFTGRLHAWCRYKGMILDPKELCNKEGRLLKTITEYEFDHRNKTWYKTGKKKTTEMIYIQTPGTDITDKVIDPCGDDVATPAPSENKHTIDF
ncbi:MAG: primase-helicase family protein [Daejeonella sp.]